MDRFAFNTAKSIRFGTGTFDELAELVSAQIGDRIMLVTDPGMMATGMVERALKQFRDGGITVELFKDVKPIRRNMWCSGRSRPPVRQALRASSGLAEDRRSMLPSLSRCWCREPKRSRMYTASARRADRACR